MARYIQAIYTIGYLQIFQTGYFILRKNDMVFKETTNYDFILRSRTCQRHLETTAANVWHLLQSD